MASRFLARSLFLLVLLATTPVVAQQEYTLGEDDEWAAGEAVDPDSPEGRLARIRQAIAEEQFERAENLASKWIDRNPRHPDLPYAYVLRGDAKVGRKNYYEALYDYELVARSFSSSEAYVLALERELDIAVMFANGTKRKMWGIRLVSAAEEAEELLIRVQERLPGSSLAEQAGIELGDYYFRVRRMSLAAEAYAIFIENYPRSRYVSRARRRLIYAHLASFKGPEFDATGLYEARVEIRRLIATEPATAQQIGGEALLRRIDESDAAKLLSSARWYLRTNNPISAEFTIRRLIRVYPRTTAAREGLQMIPRILPRLSEPIRATLPDYEAYREALLGEGVAPPDPDAGAAPVDAMEDTP